MLRSEYYLLVLKKKKRYMCRGSEGKGDGERNTKPLVIFITSFPSY